MTANRGASWSSQAGPLPSRVMAKRRRLVPPPIPPTVPLTCPLRIPQPFLRPPSPPTTGRARHHPELGRCLIQDPSNSKYWLLNVLVKHHADEEGQGYLGQEGVGLRIAGQVQGLAGHGRSVRRSCPPTAAPHVPPPSMAMGEIVSPVKGRRRGDGVGTREGGGAEHHPWSTPVGASRRAPPGAGEDPSSRRSRCR
jgi:hypothetical protein